VNGRIILYSLYIFIHRAKYRGEILILIVKKYRQQQKAVFVTAAWPAGYADAIST
jgi:hypothetical protein